jgi:hypothetical protein
MTIEEILVAYKIGKIDLDETVRIIRLLIRKEKYDAS